MDAAQSKCASSWLFGHLQHNTLYLPLTSNSHLSDLVFRMRLFRGFVHHCKLCKGLRPLQQTPKASPAHYYSQLAYYWKTFWLGCGWYLLFYPQIHVFLVLCILIIITSILMFWIIMPLILSGDKEIEWNLFFGSFLGVVALTFVVSMKGSFVAFKASFFQYNCFNKAPRSQVNLSVYLLHGLQYTC